MNINLKKIYKIIDAHEIISFDIFDTLLVRPYLKPTDVFRHIEELTAQVGFSEARITAERIACKRHKNKKESVNIDEIYEEIEPEYANLKNYELNLEEQILCVHPKMKLAYEYALKQNKKIIITSDMYLSKEFLTNILHKNGYTKWHKFYLSSEIGYCKWSGNLYKYIIKDLGIPPKKILHIGDNKKSDIDMASKYHFDCYWIPKLSDIMFKYENKIKLLNQKLQNNLSFSIYAGLKAIYGNNSGKGYWYDFGLNIGGVIVYSYTQWLIRRFNEKNIDKALFIARDGYVLQKVLEVIDKDKYLNSSYVYAPRVLDLACNLDYKTRLKRSNTEGLNAVKTICEYYKTKDQYLRTNTPNINAIEDGSDFIALNINLYKNLANEEKEQYNQYIQKHLTKQDYNIAIVDSIGCSLSAQNLIQSVLIDKNIIGLYWKTDLWRSENDMVKYQHDSYVKDHKTLFTWDLMELFMSSPEPPIFGLQENKPVYQKASEQELIRIEISKHLTKGIVDFAKIIRAVFGKYNVDFDRNLILTILNCTSYFPNKIDKKEFRRIYHCSSALCERYTTLMPHWNKENFKKSFLKKLFSITNENNRKVLCILGIKIRIKSNRLIQNSRIRNLEKQVIELKQQIKCNETNMEEI